MSYWTDRVERMLMSAEQEAFHMEVLLLRQFQQAKRDIANVIEDLFGKQDVLSSGLLKKQFKLDLRNMQDVDINKLFPGYVKKDVEGVTYLIKESQVVPVTRKLILDKQISHSVDKLKTYQDKKLKETMSKVYEDAYYEQIFNVQQSVGQSFAFARLDEKAIEVAVKGKWFDKMNFSDRTWRDKVLLEKELKTEVTQMIIQGNDIMTVVDKLAERLGVNYSAAQRLVRTEVNHIYNQASVDSYDEGGIEKYQILATLDNRTSEICRHLDGEQFKVKDSKTGKNMPPFHPWCRTTTIPIVDYNRIEKRAARDERTGKSIEVPGNMTFNQWKSEMEV